jgi:sugar phosphate isomerase/epimerase
VELSASTLAFSGHEFSSACEAIAQCGFRYVEPAFIPGYGEFGDDELSTMNAAWLKAQAAAVGLSCRSVSAHVDLGAPDAVESMRLRLAFAAVIGANYLVANAGALGSEDGFAANVERVARIAEDCGVMVCIENPGHGASIFRRGAAMAAWKQRFDHPYINLNYDFGNIFTANNEQVDPAEDMLVVAPIAAHFHVKDVLSDADGWRMCAIGKGSIDYPSILARLASVQPDAALSVEMPLRLSRPMRGAAVFGPVVPIADVAAELKQSLAFIERNFRPAPPKQTENGENLHVSYD